MLLKCKHIYSNNVSAKKFDLLPGHIFLIKIASEIFVEYMVYLFLEFFPIYFKTVYRPFSMFIFDFRLLLQPTVHL